MIVCLCYRVSSNEIRDAAKFLNAKTIEELQCGLEVCQNCEVCKPYIEAILQETVPSVSHGLSDGDHDTTIETRLLC
jgi:bacterioferritin-associated ferredoxin